MASLKEPFTSTSKEDEGRYSFDVTQVLGTVEITPDGTELPPVAAMRLICENDSEGTFTFDDGIYAVSVTMERSPKRVR